MLQFWPGGSDADRRPVTGEFVEMPELLQSYKPQYVKVKSADYIKSSLKARDWPKATMPEIAVIGRSNVGKSSLINMLTGRKELALVSKTPGEIFTSSYQLGLQAGTWTWYIQYSPQLPEQKYRCLQVAQNFCWPSNCYQSIMPNWKTKTALNHNT